MVRDARGRIMGGDPRFGLVCDCGNLKGKQARMCRACFRESFRDADYWLRRTCECGGPKSARSARCRACADELMRGVPRFSREQPADHPWRRAA